MDTSRVGVVAAELMERIAAEYDGENVEIGEVAVVVEIVRPGVESDPTDFGWSYIAYRCTDVRPWVQGGLFDAAWRATRGDAA